MISGRKYRDFSIVVGLAVTFFASMILIGQSITPGSYSPIKNTVSELGAQGYDKAWIMRVGLIAYGLLIFLGMVLRLRQTREYLMPDLLVIIYGLGILLAGVFSTAPFEAGIDFSQRESSLHSLFATAAGIALSIGMISYFFAEEDVKRKLFHFSFAVAVVGFSALFGLAENGQIPLGKGLVQRIMYMFGLSWLFINYCLSVAPSPDRRARPL